MLQALSIPGQQLGKPETSNANGFWIQGTIGSSTNFRIATSPGGNRHRDGFPAPRADKGLHVLGVKMGVYIWAGREWATKQNQTQNTLPSELIVTSPPK